jgi:mannose-6-phosphate isomerase-like protein (cupin superfamily)
MSNAAWPSELDALAAAPENHKLLFENDSVRVLDTIIQPGQTTPLHTHQWPAAIYAISVGDFIRRDENGSVILDSRNVPSPSPGAALWIPPLPPHTLENIGATDIRFIAIEIKSKS